jgi:ABC-2 type transport system permease protein
MIWKSSFKYRLVRHDVMQVFLQNYGLLVVGLLVFCVLIPVSTAGFPGSSIFNVEHTHQQMKFRFFAGDFVSAVNAAAVLYGGGLGLALYRFMLDKKQTTAFFSLGLTRRKLFFVRYGAGVFMLLAGLGIPMAVSLCLNVAALGVSTGLYVSFIYICAGLWLLSLVAFTLCAVGCCLAGTLFEAAAFSLTLLLAPTLLCYSVNIFMKQLLWGNAFGALAYSGRVEVGPNLVSLFAPANPILFFWRPAQTHSMFYRSLTEAQPPAVSWELLLIWAAVAAALFLGALLAIERRKAEQAGISGLNSVFQRLAIFLCCFSLSGLTLRFVAVFSLDLAYLAVAVVLIGCDILLRLTLFPVQKGWRSNTIFLSGEILVTAAFIVILNTGGLGYSQRIPDVREVQSVSFSYAGSPSYFNGDITGSSSGKGYYVMSLYNYEDPRDIQAVLALHEDFSRARRRALAVDTANFAETVLPYDIQIAYQLKDGRRLVRYYDRASLAQLTAMLALDDTKKARDAATAAIMGLGSDGQAAASSAQISAAAAYRNGQIFLSDSWYSTPYSVALSNEKRQELLAAIAADVAGQTWQQRYFPREAPAGVIMFSQDGEKDSRSFAYNLENTLVYVTGSFTHTLAFLEENGLRELLDFQGGIESIAFQKYNPYGGINKRKVPLSSYFMAYRTGSPDSYLIEEDFGKKRPVTDPDKIAELMPLLQNSYFMNDGGYLAAVKLAGQDVYVYKYLPAALAPPYVSGKHM